MSLQPAPLLTPSCTLHVKGIQGAEKHQRPGSPRPPWNCPAPITGPSEALKARKGWCFGQKGVSRQGHSRAGQGCRREPEEQGGMSAEVHRLGCSGNAADAQARKGPGAEHRGSSQLIPPVRELSKLLRSRQPKEVTWSEQWEVARSGKGWMESWGVVVVLSW